MISWVSKCWGKMGVEGQFQKARLRSVYPDWSAPEPQDVNKIIIAFKGQNPQTRGQTAMNMFFSHLQRDQQNKSIPFMLKHIFIMDRLVEQQVQLQTISHYYNSQLLYVKNESGQVITEFTGKYYLYVKQKAKIYFSRNKKIFEIKQRKQYLKSCSVLQIFGQIDAALQIQKMINEVNQKFADNNKTVDLIKIIFVSFLKTYLFSYTIVNLSILALFQKIQKLNFHQLRFLQKLINYFNKEYITKFLNFLQKNKSIQAFKQVNYKQLAKIQPQFFSLLDQMLKSQQRTSTRVYEIVEIGEQIKQRMGQDLQLVVVQQQNQNLGVALQNRLLIQCNDVSKVASLCINFNDYKNFYSQSFDVNSQSMTKSKFKGDRKESLFANIGNKQNEGNIDGKTGKFQRKIWNQWKNIYAY